MIIMSYDKEEIIKALKKRDFSDIDIDYEEVLKTVEYENGQYIFTMNGNGFVFVGNILVDVMPGYKGGT